VRLFADERDRRVVTDLTHRFLLTLLGAATGIGAVPTFSINAPAMAPGPRWSGERST
jgi:ubiquinone biosynthesis protein